MSQEKLRVVLFADILEEDYDGVSVTLNKIIANVPKDKIDYLVVTSHPPNNLDDFPFPIVLCPYVKIPFQKGYRLGLPSRRKDLKQRIDDFNPHLIHYTSPSKFGTYAIKYAQKANLPVVSIYHTHFPTYIKYYLGRLGTRILGGVFIHHLTWYYKNTNLILVPTNPIKSDLVEIGIKSENMVIWGRSLNTELFNPSKRDKNYFKGMIPEESKKVLFVSRLIKEKDMGSIVGIYQKLQETQPNYKVIIVGDGPERSWMEKDMPNAVFLGRRVGEELATIYASCDIFFFTSNTETFGNVILEAQSSALPVVAANAGGPIDLVKEGERGYLVEPGDVEGFCERITEILEDETLHKSMSDNALAFALEHKPEAHHNQLWCNYEKAIQEYQGAEHVCAD